MTLRLESVDYRYAGSASPALQGVELELEPGRIVGLVGPNGAGKSTLCIVAVGLAPGTIGGELTGRVMIDDLDTTRAPQSELAQRVGILFQEAHSQLSGAAPTVWEEVAFAPRNLSLPLHEVVERAWSAIDALGIEAIIDRDPARISAGQAQLVALAGVLALRPRYLILDEPTSQLDPLGTRIVADALQRAVAATGAGILITEHKTDLLERLCDDVIVLDGGRMTALGPAGHQLGAARLEERGVAPPSSVRLRRAVESAGLHWDPEWA